MVFAVFDHDSLVANLQRVWQNIAPAAMFTAAANNQLALNEDFTNALDIIRWNQTVSNLQNGVDENNQWGVSTEDRDGYGFSYGSTAGSYTNPIKAQTAHGSNNSPSGFGDDGLVETWNQDGDMINVPAGFTPIRGENIIYADTLPPSTLQVA